MPTPDRNVLLLGGGHAHALVLRALARQRLAGARVTLVSERASLYYSGMLPGHVAGECSREEIEIDLKSLAAAAGATFVEASVVGIDPGRRKVRLFGRDDLSYDLCSLNVGGLPSIELPGREAATPVKPVDGFLTEIRRLEAAATKERRRVVVVGAGAGGVEIALALARRFGSRIQLSLIGKDAEPMPTFPRSARRRVRGLFAAHGITPMLAAEAVRIDEGVLRLADGRAVAFDHLFWVTEARPPAWLAGSGLAVSPEGRLLVDETLRTVLHPEVFGVGDAAVVANRPRPRAGVFAVRAAKPLEANLRATLSGTALERYRPQRTYLSLMSTSTEEALAVKGPVVLHGRMMKLLKDRIDRAFVAGFRNLSATGSEHVDTSARRT